MHSIDEYERFGFHHAEIVGFLAAHNIPIDLGDEMPIDLGDKVVGVAASSKPFPEWKRIMSLEPSLTVGDWVSALIDVDPYESGFLSDSVQADFRRYENLLRGAISRKELPATEGVNERNEKTWRIAADALQAWCEAKGIAYPLPQAPAVPHAKKPVPVMPQPPLGRWPWGDHSTRALGLLADAAKQWWSTYDPEDPGTAPTNSAVIEYLTAKGVSVKLADSIASILRADDLPTGRRKGSADMGIPLSAPAATPFLRP
jgi:hypothetical protein